MCCSLFILNKQSVLADLMDRTYDRNLPVSSLTISRFVDNISSKEEVDQAEYYLYKFRHSPNCWYLRDWTIHGWIRQCLKYGSREKALHTLKNKVQYGIFPDDFTFNLLLDSYIKDGDFKSESAQNKRSHGTNRCRQELSSTPETDESGGESGAEENKEQEVVDEDDEAEKDNLPHYVSRFKELRSQLETLSKVESAPFQTLVTTVAQQNLAEAEKLDLEQYEGRIRVWEAEKRQLIQREKELREKAEQERRERLEAKAAAQQA
uniref:Mitochondrial ribosomal protein S27 n=1 Tax=Nothobranchius furzeri TaxID=105023 RepID=A0A8C6NSG0_NOTFU